MAERFSRWPLRGVTLGQTDAMLVVLLGSLGMLVGLLLLDAGILVGSLIPCCLAPWPGGTVAATDDVVGRVNPGR